MHDVIEHNDYASSTPARDLGPLGRAWRSAFPFVVVGALWEVVAHLGVFPAQFFPPLETIAGAFVRLTLSGVLPHHAFDTLVRLGLGFALAAIVGVAIGVLMGRSRRAEDILLPLVSIGAPIPGLAYAPLFLLWFGPGNVPAVVLVAFVSAFPIIYNSWSGVKAVKDIWLRSAQAMGVDADCFVTSSCRARCRISSPGCGSVWRRHGAFWSRSKCSPPCPGGWVGSFSARRNFSTPT
jgi:ABC-type nitrate/sulfonate/bicarbonate transport system permease component